MKSIAVKVMLVAVVLAGGVFALAGTANASHVKAEVTVPGQATVGQPMAVQVTLRSADEGLPAAGVPVTFYTDASFAGVGGEVEIGRAVTDENGLATLNHQPRSAAVHEIRVEYLPPGETEPEVASTAFSVAGATQLYQSKAGVEIPGLNVWLLIALVSTIWAILLSVALRVIAIARAGSDSEMVAESAAGPGHAERQAAAQPGPSAFR